MGKIFLFVVLSFFGCKNPTKANQIENKEVISEVKKENDLEKNNCSMESDLSKFIFSLDKDVDPYRLPQMQVDELGKIFVGAKIHQSEVLELVDCDNLSEDQKRILLLQMNGLSLKEYIEYLNQCYQKFKEDKISKYNFHHSILFNNWGHRYYISKYYKHQKIQELINKILDDKNIDSELKSDLEEVLSGKHWDETKKFYSGAGMSNPKLLEGW